MHRRVGFVVSVCGMAFIVMSLALSLQQPEFVMAAIGFGLLVIGVFFAIESVARSDKERKR